jgi:putative transposase
MPRSIEIHEPVQELWALGQDRLRVLSELAAERLLTRALISAAARDLNVSRSRCYELLRRFRASPTVTALLPRTRGRTSGARMLDGKVELIIETTIKEYYLNRRRPSVADLVREIERECVRQGLAAPSYNAVARRLVTLNQKDVLRLREGASVARRKLGRIVGRLTEEWPLGLVQIDHTLADVVLVSSEGRRPLKRPWLTLAIDVV